ncbi:MAG: hypothetical protein HW407_1276 [Bacteroidetes bacterium]|nr:hypothetical protein [Bacteroidota bacterium]
MKVTKSHSRLGWLLIAGLFALSTAYPQQYFSPGLQSLDTPSDPRSIAMGESFVAVRSTSAMMYNPAGLAGLHGASFSFARRNLNHLDPLSLKYITFTGTLETPFANFGLLYNRFIQGEVVVTSASSPDGTLGTVSLADYILGVTAARALTDGLDAGLTVKTFRFVAKVVSGNPPIASSNTPVLFDLGLVYSHTAPLVNAPGTYTISLGTSLQNFGTDFKPMASGQQQSVSNDIVNLPRYLRAGVAFSMNILPDREGDLVPFALLVTGEYRNFLNGPVDGQRSFWGFGGEVTLFEFVSGRIGEYIQPYQSIYGTRGDPSLRYGVGMALPLARFGIESPLIILIDYGVIPLNTRLPYFFVPNGTLHVFSIGLQYENQIF